MFSSKMHFLFSVRKKYTEKFNTNRVDYAFFKAASDAYDQSGLLNLFFDSIRLSEKIEDLSVKLTSFGVEIPDEQNKDDWHKRIMGKKNYIMLFYDDQGRFIDHFGVGLDRGCRDLYTVRKKFIRKNAVWMWLVDAKFGDKIKDNEYREKFLSKGKALVPYEMWLYWLNVAG